MKGASSAKEIQVQEGVRSANLNASKKKFANADKAGSANADKAGSAHIYMSSTI